MTEPQPSPSTPDPNQRRPLFERPLHWSWHLVLVAALFAFPAMNWLGALFFPGSSVPEPFILIALLASFLLHPFWAIRTAFYLGRNRRDRIGLLLVGLLLTSLALYVIILLATYAGVYSLMLRAEAIR